MKRSLSLLLAALLIALPASAHRRYIKYVTTPVADSTTGAGTFTPISELGMPVLVNQALAARCYIITHASSTDVGVLFGLTGPITGGYTVTGVIEPEWPGLEETGITALDRSGENGCPDGLTCITSTNTQFRVGDYVRVLNAGDMNQIIGMQGQVVTYDPGFPNYYEIDIDSSLFTPWGGLGADIVRIPPSKQFISNSSWPYIPAVSAAPTSLGATRTLTDIRLMYLNGTAGTATITDINRGGTADTPSCTAGLTCIVANTHGLNTGDLATFRDIGGTVQLNNATYPITKVNANNFTIAVNSSTFGAYTSGGTLSASLKVTPTFNPATAGTATVDTGSWCEYSYEVGD